MTVQVRIFAWLMFAAGLCLPLPADPQAGQDDKSRKPAPVLIRDDQTQQPDMEIPADETVEPDPIKAERAFEVACYYVKRKQYDAAIMRFREAVKYKPDFAEAKWRFVDTLIRKKDWRNAVEFAKGYLADPNMKDYVQRLSALKTEAEKHLAATPAPKENE